MAITSTRPFTGFRFQNCIYTEGTYPEFGGGAYPEYGGGRTLSTEGNAYSGMSFCQHRSRHRGFAQYMRTKILRKFIVLFLKCLL